MNHKNTYSETLASMARKCTPFLFCLFLLLLSVNSQLSQGQTGVSFPPADLLCISECETCPVICSPPPSPPSPPPPTTPKSQPPPPPPVHHHSPPQPYYFDTPSPSSSPPAAHPPPRRPPPPPLDISRGGGGGVPPPPPPSVYVYNPGTAVPPVMGQRNVTYPYYYFYTSDASSCYVPLRHRAFILLVLFICLLTFV